MSITSIDLFAGGGGASEGILRATGKAPVIAVNHDDEALKMHAANHPGTLHLCENVLDVDPIAPDGKLDLLWASPDCFPAGTTILTSRGCVPIETVEEGELVLTHRNRWRLVTSTMKSVKRVRKIRGHGHPGLVVSDEHPFFVRRRTHSWNNDSRSYDRHWSDPSWVQAKDIAPLTKGPGNLPEGHYWATPSRVDALPIPEVGGRGMVIDEKLLWLAGMYVADGWSRFTVKRAELVIICGHHEVDVRRDQLNVWPRIGARASFNELSWAERNAGTASQFSTGHRGLVAWLRKEFGHLAHNKRLPGWLLGASVELRRAFLEGYLEGDGHGHGNVIEAKTVSSSLAFGLRVLLATLDEVSTVYLSKGTNTIEGRKVSSRPAYSVRYRTNLNPQHTQHFDGGEHLFTPIRAVQELEEEVVYNISVEEDESYIADSIVVHNCRHFSRAKGGKPVSKSVRMLPWAVIKWAQWARPSVIGLENVKELTMWGPLHPSNHPDPKLRDRPIKALRGHTFKAFVAALRDCGYDVEWRVLCAADYGVPTTRERLFLIARSDGLPIVWPEPTHGPGRSAPYLSASGCIDWSIPSPSIFMTQDEAKQWAVERRKTTGQRVGAPRRPLKPNTLARIAEGIKRYVLEDAKPFLLNLTHGGRLEPLDEPFRTITGANRGEKALITPYLATIDHQSSSDRSCVMSPNDPLSTITTKNRHMLLAPVLIQTRNGERKGQRPRTLDIRNPLNTVTASGSQGAVVSALLQSTHSNPVYRSPRDPMATITASAGGHQSLVSAFLVKYYGQGVGQDLRDPLHTITTRARFGLVNTFLREAYDLTPSEEVDPAWRVNLGGTEYVIADIGMRMLTARELARAQGFRDDYILTGSKTTQIHKIGNSVPPPLVEAIVRAQFGAEPHEFEMNRVA